MAPATRAARRSMRGQRGLVQFLLFRPGVGRPRMPIAVIDVKTAVDQRDVVHRAVQALAEGKLVVFPTETVYGLAASALNEQAVAALIEAKQRATGHPFSLAIKSADDALDYAPNWPPLAERLARRCWPGPVTLVLDASHPDSAVRQLPDATRLAVCPEGTIGLRAPAHEIVMSVLRLSAGPLMLTSANRSGEREAVTADQAIEAVGDCAALVLDDGPTKYTQPSTVVKVDAQGAHVLREGVINKATLGRLSSLMIVVVCTGNTCRSPMAEVLLRKRMAARLGCSLEALEDRGVMITSAGIAAMAGGRPAREAVEVMQDLGLDLSSHMSQPLSERLVRFADVILTMTSGHREAIVAQWPSAAARTQLLCASGGDVSDPIGGPRDLYRSCAEQIDAELAAWIEHLDVRTIPNLQDKS